MCVSCVRANMAIYIHTHICKYYCDYDHHHCYILLSVSCVRANRGSSQQLVGTLCIQVSLSLSLSLSLHTHTHTHKINKKSFSTHKEPPPHTHKFCNFPQKHTFGGCAFICHLAFICRKKNSKHINRRKNENKNGAYSSFSQLSVRRLMSASSAPFFFFAYSSFSQLSVRRLMSASSSLLPLCGRFWAWSYSSSVSLSLSLSLSLSIFVCGCVCMCVFVCVSSLALYRGLSYRGHGPTSRWSLSLARSLSLALSPSLPPSLSLLSLSLFPFFPIYISLSLYVSLSLSLSVSCRPPPPARAQTHTHTN